MPQFLGAGHGRGQNTLDVPCVSIVTLVLVSGCGSTCQGAGFSYALIVGEETEG